MKARSNKAYREARKEQEAREKGRSIPYYAKKVTEEFMTPASRGKLTPSKKAGKSNKLTE
ncbi:MAG: hypothetical protein ACTHMT_07370 [Verrucomicrobiota bacterium]|jgi:hypothetical protein